MLDRRRVAFGDGVVEVDVLVAAVEPPPGHLVPVTIGPLLNDLAPFLGEGPVERLVPRALWQAKSLLSAGVLVGHLAGQIEHQLDALRLKCLIKLQRQIARGTALPRRVARALFIGSIGRVEVTGVLPQGQHEVPGAHLLQLGGQRLHVKLPDLFEAFVARGEEVDEHPVLGLAEPVGVAIGGFGLRAACQREQDRD